MRYRSRGLRRCGESDNWEVTLSHKDPMTGKTVNSYHTVQGKTRKATERAHDALLIQLNADGGVLETRMTVREYMDSFRAHMHARQPMDHGSSQPFLHHCWR